MHPTDPAPASPLPPAELLPDDPATLKEMIRELLASLQEHQRENQALRHRLALLLRRLYGPRNERFDPDQLLLFATPDPTAAPPTEPVASRPAPRRCRPHGRRRLPEQLPRQTRHYELSEAERLCGHCGQLRIDIGVERSEQLEYQPASLFVLEHVVHKYACPHCSARSGGAGVPAPESLPMSPPEAERSAAPPAPALPEATDGEPAPGAALPEGPAPERRPEPPSPPAGVADPGAVVIAAAKPAGPLPKGLPGAGLLAHLIVSKYSDHLPLHRLERIYEREGVLLPRSTLCDWLGSGAELLRPLYEQMVAVVLQSRVVHTDDTPVKVQDPATHQLGTGRLWVYLGDAAHPYNVFDFTLTRQRDGPQQFLAPYQGYLQADAFSGYDGLYLPAPGATTARIVEVACNAHARRKFYEARGSDALRAHQALAYYRQLYELERAAQDFSEEQRLQMRQELALPILEEFHRWLEAQRAEVLPKSPMAEAIGYALNQWTALKRYTEAGCLAIDNNAAEREMKRIALGRKNWLFLGSPRGGQTAAVLFSLTSTCQRLGIAPWAYLQDILSRLPGTPPAQLGGLLPKPWQAARLAAGLSLPTAAPEGSSSPESAG